MIKVWSISNSLFRNTPFFFIVCTLWKPKLNEWKLMLRKTLRNNTFAKLCVYWFFPDHNAFAVFDLIVNHDRSSWFTDSSASVSANTIPRPVNEIGSIVTCLWWYSYKFLVLFTQLWFPILVKHSSCWAVLRVCSFHDWINVKVLTNVFFS